MRGGARFVFFSSGHLHVFLRAFVFLVQATSTSSTAPLFFLVQATSTSSSAPFTSFGEGSQRRGFISLSEVIYRVEKREGKEGLFVFSWIRDAVSPPGGSPQGGGSHSLDWRALQAHWAAPARSELDITYSSSWPEIVTSLRRRMSSQRAQIQMCVLLFIARA